jgi:hypothetical protein
MRSGPRARIIDFTSRVPRDPGDAILDVLPDQTGSARRVAAADEGAGPDAHAVRVSARDQSAHPEAD